MSLGRLWHQQGKRKEARDLLAEVYAWFTEGFDTADLQEAKALLEELAEKWRRTAIVLEGPSRWKEARLAPSNSHSAGTSTGAPLSLIKNTRNFDGLVLLAFRPTT